MEEGESDQRRVRSMRRGGEKDGETVSGWSGRKWSCHCRPEQDSRALQGAAKKQFKQAENNKEQLLEKDQSKQSLRR